MKYASEMGSDAMIYIRRTQVDKDYFRHLKVNGGGGLFTDIHTHSHREHGDLISIILFFQNKEVGYRSKEIQ
jgi:hypothetical protein